MPHVSPGLMALLAAIVVALVGGAAWRHTNGRMRTPRSTQEGNGVVRLPVATATAAWETTPGASTVLARGTTPVAPEGEAMPSQPADQKLRLTGEQIGS